MNAADWLLLSWYIVQLVACVVQIGLLIWLLIWSLIWYRRMCREAAAR